MYVCVCMGRVCVCCRVCVCVRAFMCVFAVFLSADDGDAGMEHSLTPCGVTTATVAELLSSLISPHFSLALLSSLLTSPLSA